MKDGFLKVVDPGPPMMSVEAESEEAGRRIISLAKSIRADRAKDKEPEGEVLDFIEPKTEREVKEFEDLNPTSDVNWYQLDDGVTI